jgi:hypothetical protein
VVSFQDALDYANNGGNADGSNNNNPDPPQEGQTRDWKRVVGFGAHAVAIDAKQYYHREDGKWYFEDEYYEKFRTTIRRIGQGEASIEVLGSFNFTEDVLVNMISWALSAYDYYGGQVPKAYGNINTDDLTTVAFFLPALRAIKGLATGLILESSISRAMGSSYVAMGEVTVPIKNAELLKLLNTASKGDWVKVYEAAIHNGVKVETHYFRNNVTRKVFDVKIKYQYWHQKAFKKIAE